MIEKCGLCKKEHEVGDGDISGIPLRICPEMPEGYVMIFDPNGIRVWPQDTEDYTYTNLEWEK